MREEVAGALRNLRGRGFEHYPPIFDTAAKTGFLTAVASAPLNMQSAPQLIMMEYRHLRTLASWAIRCGLCAITSGGRLVLNRAHPLNDACRRYLRALAAEIGEWTMASDADQETCAEIAPEVNIKEAFGDIDKIRVLISVAIGAHSVSEIAAQAPVNAAVARKNARLWIRSSILETKEPNALALGNRPSNVALRDLLASLESALVQGGQ